MNKPLISITSACLNSENTIKYTIESVLNQTYTNIEFVLVDGNSNDKTVDIIHSYKEAFQHKGIVYKCISEPDLGIYDALNKANTLATGEIIGVIGSDDWYELNALELVADQFIQTGVDCIHGDINVYDSERNFIKVRTAGTTKEMIKRMSFFHPALFMKKQVIDALKGYSLTYDICADYDLILRMLNNEYSIVHLDKIITNVCYGGLSIAQADDAFRQSHVIRVKNGYNPFLSKFYYYRALLVHRLKTVLAIK